MGLVRQETMELPAQRLHCHCTCLVLCKKVLPDVSLKVALIQCLAAIISGARVRFPSLQGMAPVYTSFQSAVISKTVSPIETVIAIFPGCVVWLAGSLLCDLIITVSMFLLVRLACPGTRLVIELEQLTRSRRGTPFRRTEDLLTRMINLTLETGLATTIVAALELSLLVARPYEEFHEAPCVQLLF